MILFIYRLEHFFREAYALTFGLKPGEKRKFEEVTSDVIMVMRTTLSKKEFASALGMKEGDLFYFLVVLGERATFIKQILFIFYLRASADSLHTIYIRNNMGQKCEGNCGLWVLNEILKKHILKI